MNNRKILLFIVIGMIALAGLVASQVSPPSFPNNFVINFNQLPAQISSSQLFFNCPYEQGATVGKIKIWNVNGTIASPNIDVELEIKTPTCVQSIRKVFTITSSLNSQQMLSNTQTALNNFWIGQAQNNTQSGLPPQPQAVGSGGG